MNALLGFTQGSRLGTFNRNLKGEKIKVRVTDEKGQTICEAQPDSRD
jgi:hypothetical protein